MVTKAYPIGSLALPSVLVWHPDSPVILQRLKKTRLVSKFQPAVYLQTMILLVEDEERAREVFARILRKAGYAVIEAGDGLEALSLLERMRCDLVISDILMPNLNGYALVARIRAKWPDLPIVLTSGYLSQDGGKTIMDGSVEFIPKPIDSEVLIATVRRLTMRALGTS